MLNNILSAVNDWMYTYLLLFLLVGTGIYFTIRTRFVQLRLLKESFHVLKEKAGEENGKKQVSSFQALMISTASRVGTGNIAGIATAIAAGGAGAVFWMWLMAVIGGASAFIESTLAQVYKVKDKEEFRGGPSYYMEKALGKRWLGILFSVLLIICFAYGFNGLQSFNMSSSLEYYIPGYSDTVYPMLVGLILAVGTAFVIFGGVHRIGFITSVLVPIMAGAYLLIGLYTVITNITELPKVFSMIFSQAFDFKAFAGGMAGSAVVIGIKRGLFSNEAGSGSAPCAAATAETDHPAKVGLGQALGVFIDTILICTCTAMIMLLTPESMTNGLGGMDLLQAAMDYHLGTFGVVFIAVMLWLFSFSTFIGILFYARSNVAYLFGDNWISQTGYKIIALIMLFVGGLAAYTIVWDLGDVGVGLMTLFNIFILFPMSKKALASLADYEKKYK